MKPTTAVPKIRSEIAILNPHIQTGIAGWPSVTCAISERALNRLAIERTDALAAGRCDPLSSWQAAPRVKQKRHSPKSTAPGLSFKKPAGAELPRNQLSQPPTK